MFLPFIPLILILAATSLALPQKPVRDGLVARAASPAGGDAPIALTDLTLKSPRVSLRQLNFQTSCSATQKQKITQSFEEALQIIDNVLNTATEDSLPYKIFMDLGQTQNGGGCEVDTIAWTVKSDLQINFCSNFFNGKVIGTLREFTRVPSFSDLKCKDNGADGLTLDTAAAGFRPSQIDIIAFLPAHTVVHELAHLLMANSVINKIMDCYYRAFAAEFMAMQLPDAAMGNADNYAYFVLTQYLNTLCGEPDQVIYRATTVTKHLVIYDSFQAQYKAFEAKKATKVAARAAFAKAKTAMSLAKQQILEEAKHSGQQVEEGGFPVTMTAAQQKKINVADQAAAKADEAMSQAKDELDDYDQSLCDTGMTWSQILGAMAGRVAHV